jgi:aminoglycoside phosphotransferase (APT) family kinase protein
MGVGVLERDPEATATTLARWLQQVAGVQRPAVADVSIPGSTGWSNETVLFDAAWGDGDERRTRGLVARIAPSGYQVFPDETFLRQHAVMHALAERTDVPMARIHWLETDRSWFGQPFWIMDRIAGDIPTDTPPYAGQRWLHDASPEQQARAWWAGVDAMVRVHRVDVGRLGLPPGAYPDAEDTLAGHLDDLERYLTWTEEGTPDNLISRALADVLDRAQDGEKL